VQVDIAEATASFTLKDKEMTLVLNNEEPGREKSDRMALQEIRD
jgi:hypothetical protein